MLVFILASWYPSEAEPAPGVFIEEQAVALRRRHDVVVIAPERRSWRRTVLSGRGSGLRIEQRRGLDVVRIWAGSPLPWSWRLRQAAYVRAAGRAFDEAARVFGRPDLLHAHVVLPGGDAALRIGRTANIPVVLTEHSGPFSMHLTDQAHRSRTAATLAGMDAVVAVSPALSDQVVAFRPQTEVRVIGNVIDTDFFSPGPATSMDAPPEEFTALSVGLLTRNKGMDRVIDGISLAASRIPRPVTLRIAGDGPERASLEAQAGRTTMAGRIQFLGALDRDGVRDAMRTSDAFLLASESETFGVVIAEAMACGCPVITTRSGGPQWVVGQGCGILVPVGDAPALADAIVGLACGQSDVDTNKARQSIVDRFGQDAVVGQLEVVYREVLSRRGRAD